MKKWHVSVLGDMAEDAGLSSGQNEAARKALTEINMLRELLRRALEELEAHTSLCDSPPSPDLLAGIQKALADAL